MLIAAFVPLFSYPVDFVKVSRQRSFGHSIPAGDYSGIAYLGNDRYAVVSDKSPTEGFFVFHISIDSVKGKIVSVANEGFRSSGCSNRDHEGVAFVPQWQTVFVAGEADNRVKELTLDGKQTGRELQMPPLYSTATANYGLESLSYNAATHRFWTTSESTLPADGQQATSTNHVKNMLRLQSFGDDLLPCGQYFYEMDAPVAKRRAARFAIGVSEICALDDGRLIVMEREFYVPRRKLGSYVNHKLYEVWPDTVQTVSKPLPKRLLAEFRTRLDLLHNGLANYEGLCLGPRLADGSRVIVLVSDSQSRYRGVLKDWFKTIVAR